MIITKTPTRLSLVGGGTDFPAWFRKHGGITVGGALNKYSFISARYLPPFHEFRTRVVYSQIETVFSNDEIQHRAIRACLEHAGLAGDSGPGLEISHSSDLPGRSGTGSSSTFVVGLVNALAALQGKRLLAGDLADAAMKIEQERLGETVGCQDQMFAAYGGLNVIKFQKDGDINAYPLLLSIGQVDALERHLMLFFTGVQRTSSEVAKSYAGTLGDREKEQWAMIRYAELGIEAIERQQFQKLGEVIDASWRVKAGLSNAVSTSHISDLYATARLCGAWGGKITGAGGGGCLVLVAPPEKHAVISKHLTEKGCVHIPFRFSNTGSEVIFAERNAINEYRP